MNLVEETHAVAQQDTADSLADMVASLKAPLGEIIPALTFLLGDALSQLSNHKQSAEVAANACKQLVIAYTIHCDAEYPSTTKH